MITDESCYIFLNIDVPLNVFPMTILYKYRSLLLRLLIKVTINVITSTQLSWHLTKDYTYSSSAHKEIEDPKLMEQKLWLDAEMEKIIEQRKQVELLDKVKNMMKRIFN